MIYYLKQANLLNDADLKSGKIGESLLLLGDTEVSDSIAQGESPP